MSPSERARESFSARTLRPRVVWDMTFTIRNLTGTRVYTQNLFRALKAASDWEFQELYGTREIGSERRGNLRANVANLKWLAFSGARAAQRTHPNLFHAAAFLAPLHLACPLVVNVFDTTYLTFPQFFDWKWNFYARTFIPSGIQNARAILTLSEHARGEIVRHYNIPRERVHVVSPGIDSEFQPSAAEADIARVRAKYNLAENYLIYVGGRHPRKNLTALVAAFAQTRRIFPELQFALVGPIHADPNIEQTLAEWGVRAAVRELDFVPHADLPLLYAGARAFVYASKLEGFGIPPVEAMACGTPVVCAPNPPMPQVLGDAACFTSDDSPEALAHGIVRVLKDAALAETLRACGIERARLYTWENAARKTLAVYESVLRNES